MSRAKHFITALGSGAAIALLASPSAHAQAQPKVTSRASATQVEVGEPFTIELKAMVEQGNASPGDPQLRVPPGIVAADPSISTQTFAQFGGGRQSVQTGISATWRAIASAPGKYNIAGPSVVWNGRRITTPNIAIEVVPATGRSRGTPASPFLMPGGPPGLGFPWPFGSDKDDEKEEPQGGGVAELALPTASDPSVFLHARLDKKEAVIGEQVSITFYIYHRVDFEMTERHEAALAEFLRVPLLKNPGTDPPVMAVAGGKQYMVRVLDKVAIFPVHAGDLHTGVMSGRFNGRHIGAHVLRESEDLVLHVTEPPKQDRPTGYVLGDVGKFELQGIVQPRKIEQGGALAVSLKVSGAGNLPSVLRVPERTGVEWLEPEKQEEIDVAAGVVGGWRTFNYVVRIKDSGTIDLGKVELPFWDPQSHKYTVASASLGVIDVAASMRVTPDAPAGTARGDSLAAMPGARTSLGAYSPSGGGGLLEGARFWGFLGAPPIAVGLLFAARRASDSLKKRRETGKNAPSTLEEKSLRDAEAAEKKGDTKAMASALERAIHHGIEGATGLKSRGVLLSELPRELEKSGASADLATRVVQAIEACETLRFDPLAEGGKELGDRVRRLLRELAKVGR